MAEAAGLVLGAIGIAGIISAFKDTIDLFSLIADTRDLGRDYEILDAKLDIEKTLLLQWAYRVKLVQRDCDERLKSPHSQRLVARILACIKQLLTNTSELKHRYGLSKTGGNDLVAKGNYATGSPRNSEARMDRFIGEFEAFKLQISTQERTDSLRKKAPWVIRDKQKFEDLVKELADFITKINQVVPVVNDTGCIQLMADEDLKPISDVRATGSFPERPLRQ